jgi:hypothetical protein
MRATLLVAVAGALAFAAPAFAQPEVSVTLDLTPRQASVGDMVRLEVRVKTRGGSIEALELEDLQKYPELEIVSHQTVRPMQFSFGFGSGVQVESSLGHVYMLRPTAPGEYAFSPAVAKVDGKSYRSEPVTLVVGQGARSGSPTDSATAEDAPPEAELSGARFDERAFLRTVVEPTEAYVGQQVNVTVYLYTRLRLGPQSLVPGKPSMDGFWVYDDPITSLQAQTVSVMGARYQVYALHRSVAFPQRAGELTIGPPKVSFDVATMSFFDPPQRVEREGVPVSVNVQPLPSPAPPGAVVGRYEMQASLDRASVRTGDAVTLRIDASGVGNVQDLRLDFPPMVGVRALQPAIRDRQQLNGRILAGVRSWEWILIAESPGEHTIPPLRIDYFDPETKEYGSTTTTALMFTATGNAKPSGPALQPGTPLPSRSEGASFGPIRVYSALTRGNTPVRSTNWFSWLLAIPPLGFAFVVLAVSIARRRERHSTTAGAVQRKLIQSARAALDGDDPRTFYDRIVASITHALDTRLTEPVGGMSQSELRGALRRARFDDDLIQRVVNELEGADFARFAASGVDKAEMERCLQRTAAIIERIERTEVQA